jgi:hypothetical protein
LCRGPTPSESHPGSPTRRCRRSPFGASPPRAQRRLKLSLELRVAVIDALLVAARAARARASDAALVVEEPRELRNLAVPPGELRRLPQLAGLFLPLRLLNLRYCQKDLLGYSLELTIALVLRLR